MPPHSLTFLPPSQVNEGKKLYCKLILRLSSHTHTRTFVTLSLLLLLSSGRQSAVEEEEASQECKIKFVDEVFRIESKESASQLAGEGEARIKKPDCDFCKDNPSRKCKHCACSVCGGKESPEQQILCDECDLAYHLWCLDPPLDSIPDSDEW